MKNKFIRKFKIKPSDEIILACISELDSRRNVLLLDIHLIEIAIERLTKLITPEDQ